MDLWWIEVASSDESLKVVWRQSRVDSSKSSDSEMLFLAPLPTTAPESVRTRLHKNLRLNANEQLMKERTRRPNYEVDILVC